MFPARDRFLAAAAVGLGLLLTTGFARAQAPEDLAAARALVKQGVAALEAKQYGEALDLINRAESIVHAPTHLLFAARAQAGMGKLVAAQETYLKLMRENLAAGAIGLVAGGARAVGGVMMMVVGKPHSAEPPATGALVRPWFTGTAGGVAGRF